MVALAPPQGQPGNSGEVNNNEADQDKQHHADDNGSDKNNGGNDGKKDDDGSAKPHHTISRPLTMHTTLVLPVRHKLTTQVAVLPNFLTKPIVKLTIEDADKAMFFPPSNNVTQEHT